MFGCERHHDCTCLSCGGFMPRIRRTKYGSLCNKCWRRRSFQRNTCVELTTNTQTADTNRTESVSTQAKETRLEGLTDVGGSCTLDNLLLKSTWENLDSHKHPMNFCKGNQHVEGGHVTDATEECDSDLKAGDLVDMNDMDISSFSEESFRDEGTESGSEMSVQDDLSEASISEENDVVVENGSISSDSSSSSDSEDVFYRCDNCRREEVALLREEPEELEVRLSRVPICRLNFRQRWKTITRAKLGKGRSHATLCTQCRSVLDLDRKKANSTREFQVIWPVYMWKFLTSDENLRRYGARVLHYIPREWWRFWKKSLIWEYYSYFDHSKWDTLVNEPVIVTDQTVAKRRFAEMQKNLRLGEMRKMCDDLIPCVLCPWGCCGYRHDAGYIPFDSVIARYFPHVDFSGRLSTAYELRNMVSGREDFFSTNIQMHLFNPKWTVHPSVYFDRTKGPMFLTCDDHDGGTKEKYFHLPRTHSCLPPLFGDQLSHVVLRSRTLHQTKAKKYSNTYQMNLFMGNYSGVDSTWVSDVRRRFDFHSHLSQLYEARSYANRIDIRGLVRRLEGQGTLSKHLAADIHGTASMLYDGQKDLEDNCGDGSTMMTLYDCICLQKSLVNSLYVSIEEKGRTKFVLRKWPMYLIKVHPNNKHGAPFPRILPMQNYDCDSRALWFLSTAMVGVNTLWEMTAYNVVSADQWHGFVLLFLTRNATSHSFQMRDKTKNPFCIPRTHKFGKAHGLMSLLSVQTQVKVDCYDLVIFERLFNREKLSGRIMFLKFRFMDTLIVEEDCDILWFLNKEKRNNIAELPLSMKYGSDTFELRFISHSKRYTEKDVNSWNGAAFVRHGGPLFTEWWNCPRKGHPFPVSTYASFPWCDLDMAIYVRVRQSSLEVYRREYLKYIGGQSHVLCETHDIPLIIAPKANKSDLRLCHRYCEGTRCRRPEEFQCPIAHCTTRICKPCYIGIHTQSVTRLKHEVRSTATICGVKKRRTGGSFDLVDSSSEASESPSSQSQESRSSSTVYARSFQSLADDSSNGNSTVGQFESGDELSTGTQTSDSDDSSICLVDDCDKSIELCTGESQMGVGVGNCAPDDSDDDSLNDLQEIPLVETTHSNAYPLSVSGVVEGIGTSVLLNKCGSLLVRRQTRLQASRQQKNLVQRVVTRQDVGTVPLVYLEGLLFPSIFWKLIDQSEGAVAGSIPTVLYCQHKTRKNVGVATLAAHAKVRLKSAETPAATDPRYLCFLFDTLANGAIEGHDTRIVMSRGFESCMGPAGMRLRDKDDDLYSDGIDNRQNVHNLCAAEREKPSTLFITMTCNQSRHFGVKHIKEYIDSGEAVANYKAYLKKRFPTLPPLSVRAEKEVEQAFCESARNLIVRNWLELKHFLLIYLLKSEELPLNGKVERIFSRDENQHDRGNLPHMHMLITLKKGYDDAEGRAAIHALIRGFVDDIVTEDEVPHYIKDGILRDYYDYRHMKEEARSFLPHHHSERCMRRTGPGKHDLQCRVPDTRYISGDISRFFEALLTVRRTKESSVILRRLNLMAMNKDNELVPRREYLQSKRIYAPARFGEGNITPVIGPLFAATRSTMNVQICTSHGTTRYVVKYVIKIDENNYVAFSSKQGEDVLKAEKVFLHNTKITSSAKNEAKRLHQSRDSKKPRGRAVASTEMMQIILGKPQVFCNTEFVRVQTLPLGERSGIERKRPKDRFTELVTAGRASSKRDSFDFMVPTVRIRNELFPHLGYRRHTDSQILMLKDQMICPVTLDQVFIFGIRPPELLAIDKMEWYFKFFERSTKMEKGDDLIKQSLYESAFIDGMSCRIKLRVQAIPELAKLLKGKPFRDKFLELHAEPMLQLLDKICTYFSIAGITDSTNTKTPLSEKHQTEWQNYQELYTTYDAPEKRLPIIVFSNVKPRNACKFAIHLLLSMGHFATERDLWVASTIRESFIKAGLLSSDPNLSLTCKVDLLLKYWIEDQLRYYPVGSSTMDEYIVSADDILRALIIDNVVPVNEIPPVMYTALVRHTDAKIEAFIAESKASMIEATLKTLEESYSSTSGLSVLPTKTTLLSTTRSQLPSLLWNPILPKTSSQTWASYREQSALRDDLIARIEEYRRAGTVQPKNMLIAGPPGVGKTHCLSHSVCYALSRGLTVITTAVLAERAFLLGGKHLHMLFKLKPRTKGTPHRLAELAVISLQKHVEFLALLRTIDILYIDECGQISAKLLAVLDIILRKIRNSSLFMGGILVIGTIDQVQLRPIDGLPFLLSPYILTTFRMHILKCYVRCSDCPALQEMNTISRNLSCARATRTRRLNRLRTLLSENCTFVSDWDDPLITDDVLRIFPHRADATTAVVRFLKKKKDRSASQQRTYRTVYARDEMVAMESHADWKPAHDTAINLLNHDCREPASLDLYVGAVYQFTYNCPGRFKTTQLGVLLTVPDATTTDSFREFEIFVAPAGTKTVCYDLLTEQTLLAAGYQRTKVGLAPTRPHQVWKHGIKIRRKQYALKHHIASTVHSSIGHTVNKIATQLTTENQIWERAMVVVLISRVRRAQDLIFVGDKEANIEALIHGLQCQNQYDEYMEHVVEVITGTKTCMEPVFLDLHPFRFKDIPLPMDRTGVVYLLVSIRDNGSIYIGFTQDITTRLNKHNSGFGASESAPIEKRPWGLYAYITGFGGCKVLLREVEARWQNRVQYLKPNSPRDAVAIGQRLINREYSENELIMVTASETL